MQISHRKEFLELTFRALALRQGRKKKELTKLNYPEELLKDYLLESNVFSFTPE